MTSSPLYKNTYPLNVHSMKEPYTETLSIIFPDDNRWYPVGQFEISLIKGLFIKVQADCRETIRDKAESGEEIRSGCSYHTGVEGMRVF